MYIFNYIDKDVLKLILLYLISLNEHSAKLCSDIVYILSYYTDQKISLLYE